MNIVEVAKQRFTTKAYDSEKKLTAEQHQQLLDLLRYSPSSLNLQPWHFFVATSDEGKAQILPGIRDFNAAKVQNAAMVVVFATVDQLDEQHLAAVHAQETEDGRFKDQASGDANDNGRRQYVAAFTGDDQNKRNWLERQAYISLGFLLLGAASLGLHATPIEGFDPEKMDEVLGLKEKGLHSLVVASVGFNSEKDFNAVLPKSRFSEQEVITEL